MIKLTVVVAVLCVGFCHKDQKKGYKFNDLNLKHDHCRHPQTFDRDNWTCVCPQALTKVGEECVCDGCLFHTMEDKYLEKFWDDLVDYWNDEIDRKTNQSEDEFGYSGGGNRPDRSTRDVKTMETSEISSRGLFPQVVSPRIDTLFFDLQVSHPRARVFRMKEKPRFVSLVPAEEQPLVSGADEVPVQEEIPETEQSDSFSDSVLFGGTSGSVSSGSEKAFGSLFARKGTGSLAMAAKNGTGAASAYTGEGFAQLGIKSDGNEASGFSIIGPKAKKASSTLLLMGGKGDAVATNTLDEHSSGSAAAVATQELASASSAAYGSSVAAASAAPGKGGVNSSADYGDTISVSANVKGKNSVAESVSVGDARDSLQLALEARKSKPEVEEPVFNFPDMDDTNIPIDNFWRKR